MLERYIAAYIESVRWVRDPSHRAESVALLEEKLKISRKEAERWPSANVKATLFEQARSRLAGSDARPRRRSRRRANRPPEALKREPFGRAERR